MFTALHKLSTTNLRGLAALCRQCAEATIPSTHALQQLAGNELAEDISWMIRDVVGQGWDLEQVANVADTVAGDRLQLTAVDSGIDLVLSGPDAPGIATRDTAAVMHALLAEAKLEVLLVGFAIHNAKQLFEPLALRLASEPGLRVWCCFDIRRAQNDTSSPAEIVTRFARDFSTRHWPWEPKPEVYYDPRSLEPYGARRSSLHAKCVIVDRRVALITSANFTEAAQERNIECGALVRQPMFVDRLQRYFEALRESLQLVSLKLPA